MSDSPAKTPWLPASLQALRQIGRGASGEVWLADDLRMNRRVAVKRFRHSPDLPEGFNDPAGAAARESTERLRFKREFMTLSRLDVPGIVKAHEVFASEGELIYTMEYVAGQPIHEYLSSGDWRPAGAGAETPEIRLQTGMAALWELMDQLLLMLAGLHRHGIFHRDLKPEHLLVEAAGRLRLIDFSLAADLDAAAITRHGEILGTPHYMAPEQAMSQPCDGRADLYAVGVMLFEMVTGRRPFEGTSALAVLMARVQGEAPSPREFNPLLTAAQEACILRLLARDPAARYPNALMALDGLRRCAPVARPRKRHTTASRHAVKPPAYPGLLCPPWTGNPQAMAAVTGALERLRHGGSGLLLVEGPAGSGKSRLGQELLRLAAPMPVQTIHCAGDGGDRGQAIARLIAQLIAPVIHDAGALAALLGRDASVFARYLPGLSRAGGAPDGGDALGRRAELLAAVCALVDRAAAIRPLLLWMDDLHRADPVFVEILANIARRSRIAADGAVLIVAAIAEHARWGGDSYVAAAARNGLEFEPVRLAPLTGGECGAFVAGVLGLAEAASQSLGTTLEMLSDGHPGGLSDLVRQHAERGLLRWDASAAHWRVEAWRQILERGEMQAAALPMTVAARVSARLAELPAESRASLAMAASFSSSFKFYWWQALCGVTENELLQICDAALRGGWLQERGVRLQLTHSHARPVLLSGLAADDMRSIHSRIVAIVEQDAEAARYEELLAEHSLSSGRLELVARHVFSRASALVRGRLAHEARELLDRAAGVGGGVALWPVSVRAEYQQLQQAAHQATAQPAIVN